MNQQVIDQISAMLSTLAHQLGIAVSYLFSLYIRQNYIIAIEQILFIVLTFSVLLPVTIWAYKRSDFVLEDEDGITGRNVICVITTVFLIAAIVSSVTFLFSIIDRLANPQYMALTDMLDSLKTLKP